MPVFYRLRRIRIILVMKHILSQIMRIIMQRDIVSVCLLLVVDT